MDLFGTDAPETLVGTATADNIFGFGGDDQLSGLGGPDALIGGNGNDTLLAGAGDDLLRGGLGDDLIDGGPGIDRASFASGATSAVTVDLRIQTAQDTGQGRDTLLNIEQVSGTRFSDHLIGDDQANWIWGGGDGSGVTGDDTLDGNGGDDLLQVGFGNHSVNGGAGIDTISYFGNGTDVNAGVNVFLDAVGAYQDTGQGFLALLGGVENISGGPFGDTLSGDSGDNVLAGFDGGDLLRGGAGNDRLLGDSYYSIDLAGNGGAGAITVFAGSTYQGTGNDTLDGGAGNDFLSGEGGQDVLMGGGGADTLNGGSGGDVLIGGPGADRFVFTSIADSTPTNRDVIADLRQGDIIDVSAIDANTLVAGDQAFVLVGAFTGRAGQMTVSFDSGGANGDASGFFGSDFGFFGFDPAFHYSFDVDGDARADMVIDVSGGGLFGTIIF